MKFCNFCGKEYDETLGGCPDCAVKECPRCGATLKEESLRCFKCGASMVKSEAEILEIQNSKTGLGVLCTLLMGIFGFIIGLACFRANTTQRRTFMNAWNITLSIELLVLGLIPIVAVIIYILWSAIALS